MWNEQVIVALPAIYTADDRLDVDRMRQLFEINAKYVDAAFVNGTNGEFAALSRSERSQVANLALSAFGPSRVILHVGAVTTSQVDRLISDGLSAGAKRFAVTPPLMFATDLRTIESHFARARALTKGLDLYAYLFPEIFQNTVEPESARMFEHLGLNGLKVSGAAAAKLDKYVQHLSIPVWTGDDRDLALALSRGAAGVVSGCANIDPEAWRSVKDAVARRDLGGLRLGNARIDRIVNAVGPSIAHLKLGLQTLGIGSARMRLNLPAVPAADAALIARLSEVVLLSDVS